MAMGLEVTYFALRPMRRPKALKVLGTKSGELLKYAFGLDFGDDGSRAGQSGRIVEDLSGGGRYVLTPFIEDGGKYDLDGRERAYRNSAPCWVRLRSRTPVSKKTEAGAWQRVHGVRR